MDKNTKFYLKQLEPLVGGIIKGFAIDTSNEEFYGLKIKTTNKTEKVLWLLRDDAGNGPGSFEITKV